MKAVKPVKIIQLKKSPPIWSIKVGARYVTGFMGGDAKDRAIAFAMSKFDEFSIVAKPTTKREQARLDAIAGLSDAT